MKSRFYEFSWDFIGDIEEGRPNLGKATSIVVYRLFQYTLRDILEARYGTEEADRVFYEAGFLAGKNFCEKFVGRHDSFDDFLDAVQGALLELKIGLLRMEGDDRENARFTLTMSEDLDCSGLPDMDHSVCTYDEGFIAGIFNAFNGQDFDVKETDCWCTGDRTCRFEVKPKSAA